MAPELIGVIGIVVMLVMIALGMPLAFAMLGVGVAGFVVLGGTVAAEAQLFLNLWDRGTSFSLTAVPLYLLMGALVFRSNLAADMYDCVHKWFGRLPGGLSIASILACAGFASVSGSGATTVATLAPICMPEMRKFGYDNRLAAGSLCSASTLGILIPPSIVMVVYGIWTETSIGALFIAGIVPGILLTVAFSALVLTMCVLRPELGPVGPRFPWGESIYSLVKLLPVMSIFLLVIGGIYGGVFDPAEAAGIGVAGVFAVTLAMRRLDWPAIRGALLDTMNTSAMFFVIIVGGHILGRFVVLTDLTSGLIDLITALDAPPLVVMLMFTIMYLLLGMILELWAMLILTIPFAFPIILDLGFDPIWFGVYVVMMSEVAGITPPIGLLLFIMKRMAPEIPLRDIIWGAFPFFIVILMVVALITIFPGIVLWLPRVAAIG